MTAHRTVGQQRALVELRALARVALRVCDALAARGEETDDRPRRYLDALARWTLGEEKPVHLAVATRAATAWSRRTVDGGGSGVLVSLAFAFSWLADAREDMMRNPGHKHHTSRVCRCLADTLQRIDGADPDGAEARIDAALAAERKRATAEGIDALADARRVQAKADKIEAERALGTLPGMETTR